jgi:acyl-CoA thioester hydrolase
MTDPSERAPLEERAKLLAERQERVRMVDTDASGLLYFGAVYRWAESMFGSWLLHVGPGMGEMLRDGTAVPVVHSEAEYRGPLTVDDALVLALHAGPVGRTSFGFVCDARYGAESSPRITIRTRHVYGRITPADVHTGFVPQPLPDWLRTALSDGSGLPPDAPEKAPRG